MKEVEAVKRSALVIVALLATASVRHLIELVPIS